MHAVVGVWTMEESRRTDQERGLLTEIVPAVQKHPGFVCGYWMRDPETGKAHTTIVLDSEEAAEALKRMVQEGRRVQARAQVGIINDTLAIVEVTASAQRETT